MMRKYVALAIAFALLPAAAGADVFFGTAKGPSACFGTGPGVKLRVPFTLEMEPGSSFGTLTLFGSTGDVFTDAYPYKRGWVFAASTGTDGIAVEAISGKITSKGRLKGVLTFHGHGNGCVFSAKAKAR
jgi:hypothetical protein